MLWGDGVWYSGIESSQWGLMLTTWCKFIRDVYGREQDIQGGDTLETFIIKYDAPTQICSDYPQIKNIDPSLGSLVITAYPQVLLIHIIRIITLINYPYMYIRRTQITYWNYLVLLAMCGHTAFWFGLMLLTPWTNMHMGNILIMRFPSGPSLTSSSSYNTCSVTLYIIMTGTIILPEPRINLATGSYSRSITLSWISSQISPFWDLRGCPRVGLKLSCLVLQVLYGDSRVIIEGSEACSRYLCDYVRCDMNDVFWRYLWYILYISIIRGDCWNNWWMDNSQFLWIRTIFSYLG